MENSRTPKKEIESKQVWEGKKKQKQKQKKQKKKKKSKQTNKQTNKCILVLDCIMTFFKKKLQM